MRKLKYVKLFESFGKNDEVYGHFTTGEQNTLSAIGFRIVSKGIAQIGNDKHNTYRIYKYDEEGDEFKNRVILHRGKKGFGEYGQFEVTGPDSSFERRSFDHLQDAYNHILKHKRNK